MFSYNYTYNYTFPSISSSNNYITNVSANVNTNQNKNTTVYNYEYSISNTILNTTIYSSIPTNINYINYHDNLYINTDNSIKERINLIPITDFKQIPKNSVDSITYEDINENDILIDFKRDNNTESFYGAYYKESSFFDILKSNKNPFTILPLDQDSIIKYRCYF
jgi:hypothetical protein